MRSHNNDDGEDYKSIRNVLPSDTEQSLSSVDHVGLGNLIGERAGLSEKAFAEGGRADGCKRLVQFFIPSG
jgi:hypothetical protein